jgi:hypothetical protein
MIFCGYLLRGVYLVVRIAGTSLRSPPPPLLNSHDDRDCGITFSYVKHRTILSSFGYLGSGALQFAVLLHFSRIIDLLSWRSCMCVWV